MATQRLSKSGHDLTPLTPAEIEKRAASLDQEARRVLLRQGTEPPFCGGLLKNKAAGTYACALCGLPVFRSGTKFESGTGWPSFTEPCDPEHIEMLRDVSHGMVRTEVRCARCGGHLGHVFDDGPPPAGQRFCINSVAMTFEEARS